MGQISTKLRAARQESANHKKVASIAKRKTLENQRNIIESHNTAMAGKNAETEIKLEEEQRKQDILRALHEDEINTLKAGFESQVSELNKEHLPRLNIADGILARQREGDRPHRERIEEMIDPGNLVAHGGK